MRAAGAEAQRVEAEAALPAVEVAVEVAVELEVEVEVESFVRR